MIKPTLLGISECEGVNILEMISALKQNMPQLDPTSETTILVCLSAGSPARGGEAHRPCNHSLLMMALASVVAAAI